MRDQPQQHSPSHGGWTLSRRQLLQAVAAGAASLMPPANQFYGDRCAAVKDASGNTWWMATHQEDLSPEEARRRMNALAGR